MIRWLRRLVTSLWPALAVCLLSVPAWAQEPRRSVPDLADDRNVMIYSLVTVGVLTVGILVVGFKGTKGSQR